MARDDGHDSREGASFQPVAVEEVPPARSVVCRSTSRRRRRAPCDAGRTSLRDAQYALLSVPVGRGPWISQAEAARSPVGLPSGRRRACPPPVGGPAALLAPSCPGRCPSCAAASGRRLREGAGAGRLRAVAVLAAVDLRDPASAACSCAPATHVAFVAGRLRQRARVRPPPGGGRGPWTGTPLVVRARSGCSRSPRSPRCAPGAPANHRAQRVPGPLIRVCGSSCQLTPPVFARA